MSESIRVRLMLVKFPGDTEPVVVGAIDQTVWDHWDDEDEAAWVKRCQDTWGADPKDCEWRQVWADFAPQELADAFETPVVSGSVDSHPELSA